MITGDFAMLALFSPAHRVTRVTALQSGDFRRSHICTRLALKCNGGAFFTLTGDSRRLYNGAILARGALCYDLTGEGTLHPRTARQTLYSGG